MTSKNSSVVRNFGTTVFIFIVLLIPFLVSSEPMPWGIIIKDSKCSKFWSGDEYVSYTAPNGWMPYYPDKNRKIVLNDRICKFERLKENECCEALGYKYVDVHMKKECGPATPWYKCLLEKIFGD